MKTCKNTVKSMCLFFLISLLLLTGCEKNRHGDNGIDAGAVLENGFKILNSTEESPTTYCAYKSDKSKFPVDNVTLDFSYGGYYYQGVDFELKNIRSYPSFDLYFADDIGNKFLIKHIEENFISEKYSCSVLKDENGYFTEIKFNYSESLTVPSKLFAKDRGQIWFEICAANANDNYSQTECIAGICIFYKVTDGNIVLSERQFD